MPRTSTGAARTAATGRPKVPRARSWAASRPVRHAVSQVFDGADKDRSPPRAGSYSTVAVFVARLTRARCNPGRAGEGALQIERAAGGAGHPETGRSNPFEWRRAHAGTFVAQFGGRRPPALQASPCFRRDHMVALEPASRPPLLVTPGVAESFRSTPARAVAAASFPRMVMLRVWTGNI